MTQARKLSQHFTTAEATKTSTGLDNSPTYQELAVLMYTACKMELVREALQANPIIVTSWFRSEKVNSAVGGVWNSQHRLGEAVDFVCPGFGTPAQICAHLRTLADELQYDQLILEPSWVHISFLTNNKDIRTAPRKQFLDLSRPK